MVNRKRDYRKKIWITEDERERATRIRARLGVTDADIYRKGLDDLVSEEYQGNAGAETLSMRAKMYFSISDDEWDALSEEEKNDYISRLPPAKTKAGGGEMSNRDALLSQHAERAEEVFNFFQDEMAKKTRKMEADRRKYESDRER